jgi:hypothetical protein
VLSWDSEGAPLEPPFGIDRRRFRDETI